MTDYTKIKFVNYDSRKEVTITKYKCDIGEKKPPVPANIPLEPENKPRLLINVFDPANQNTNYTNTIYHPKLKNALFIYLSNNNNSGYVGGGGGGTAAIGNYENTFGIITGHYDSNSQIPEGGFQELNDMKTFKLCHRLDAKTYNMTPKQAIDYLLGQLYTLIQTKKYEYIILPCDLTENQSDTADYKNYTIGAKIFNTASEVKNYIYEKICNLTKVNETDGWQLITDFLL